MADHEGNPVRICLWVVPRTISTALTKCLSAIDGMEVWFECFTYCSLARLRYKLASGEDLPMEYEGNEEKVQQAATIVERVVGSKVEADRIVYDNVKQRIEASRSRYILAKEGYFAFQDEKSRQYVPAGFKHVFMIRDPHRALSSYRKAVYDHLIKIGLRTGGDHDEKAFDIVRDDPFFNCSDFYRSSLESWKYIRANVDPNAIVVNSDDLLANPADVLSKLCHLTGLPYSDSLLQWDASIDVTKTWKVASDEVLKEGVAFYKTAVYSGEFLPPKPPVSNERLAPDVRRVAEASMPYYQEMNKFRI